MTNAYDVVDNVIVINRELTELDAFVQEFLEVLKGCSDYLIVSGYVSIATGRTRGTEDIDILIPVTSWKGFEKLFLKLKEKGFWCYQGDSAKSAYAYFRDLLNLRFARTNEMFPNVELIPINESKKAKFFEFTHPQRIKVESFEFKVPPLEFEILYKEIILKGDKDLADAKHLRALFSDFLSKERFKRYEPIVRLEL